jgi:hypothetical protein
VPEESSRECPQPSSNGLAQLFLARAVAWNPAETIELIQHLWHVDAMDWGLPSEGSIPHFMQSYGREPILYRSQSVAVTVGQLIRRRGRQEMWDSVSLDADEEPDGTLVTTSSSMKSRQAAISLGYKQPKAHPRLGTKKPVQSFSDFLSLLLDLFWPVRSLLMDWVLHPGPPVVGYEDPPPVRDVY